MAVFHAVRVQHRHVLIVPKKRVLCWERTYTPMKTGNVVKTLKKGPFVPVYHPKTFTLKRMTHTINAGIILTGKPEIKPVVIASP